VAHRGVLSPVAGGQLYLNARQVDEPAGAADDGRVPILVLAYCGLRWSEFAALRVRHVDLMRRRVQISEAVTEVNGSRLVWGVTPTPIGPDPTLPPRPVRGRPRRQGR
jgi:hypothetical protein